MVKARKPSSAKGEKRLKRKKIPKFVQAKALPESEIMYKSKNRCTGMKDRITRDREMQRCAKTYKKPSPQTSVVFLFFLGGANHKGIYKQRSSLMHTLEHCDREGKIENKTASGERSTTTVQ